MADDTIITSFNFNDNLPGKTLSDGRNGQDIILGYVSGLPMVYESESLHNRGLAIALFDKGIGQGELDRRCQKLSADCKFARLEVLITKIDSPFDLRWFIIGDLKQLFELAQKGKMQVPISNIVLDDVLTFLD